MGLRPASIEPDDEWSTAQATVTVKFAVPSRPSPSVAAPEATVEILPAAHGQSLLLTYGDPDQPVRILIDCGPRSNYVNLKGRLSAVPPEERHLELLIVTHIDDDRIGGAISLLQDGNLGIQFGDIWFNGWQQLELTREDEL